MFLDNFERFGVTADWKKVLPGMVYVDLQEERNRKELYHAYKNGASVIFTTQNISDPVLPVIKVNNVYETMMILLNKHFDTPQNKTKLIAISGSQDKDIIQDLLNKLLMAKDRHQMQNQNNLEYYSNSMKDMNIEDMYEYLNRSANTGVVLTPMIVDYKMKYFRFIHEFKFDCALITGVNSIDCEDRDFCLTGIKSFISQMPENKPIIVNNDDDITIKALEKSRNTIVITYGLNKKAAVTATSIDVNQQISFNYCLQRSMTTSSGKVIDPFEMPITLNMMGSSNIYSALAVITCALYYDINMEHIKEVLASYHSPNRRFELSEKNNINILDNYCSSAGELDKTFEGVQMLNYNNLIVLMSISKSIHKDEIASVVKAINQWSDLLGTKELVLTGCVDVNSELKPFSLYDLRKLKKELKEDIHVKYLDQLTEAAKYASKKAKSGDLLLVAGGPEMDQAKQLVINQIEINKHIIRKNMLH